MSQMPNNINNSNNSPNEQHVVPLEAVNTTISSSETAAANTTTTVTQPVVALLTEDALAEQSKKLPFLLSSSRKQQLLYTVSKSSSFDDGLVSGTTTNSGELVSLQQPPPPQQQPPVENEYGQLLLGRIHHHKKGSPTVQQFRALHGGTTGTGGSSSIATSSTTAASSSSSNPNFVVVLDGTTASAATRGGGTSTPRSRSQSPSIGRSGGAVAAITTITTSNISMTVPNMMNSVMTDGNSSISSMDDYECDLYTDRAGVLDDLSESQRKLHSSKEFQLPATVLERMSEDSLEDNRAFTDLVSQQRMTGLSSRGNREEGGNFSSNASRVSHVSGSNAGDGMLEPLDECDEGLENDSLEDSVTDQNYYNLTHNNIDDVGGTVDASGNLIVGGDTNGLDPNNNNLLLQPTTTVILTNMENLTLQSANNELIRQQEQGYAGSQAGSVSLFESVGGVAGGSNNNNNNNNASSISGTAMVGGDGSVSVPTETDK